DDGGHRGGPGARSAGAGRRASRCGRRHPQHHASRAGHRQPRPDRTVLRPGTDRGAGIMRVLITNDDGISSPGLTVLANVAHAAGHEVIIAAPNKQYSGYSAALSAENADNISGYPDGPGGADHGLVTSGGRPPGVSDEVESIAVHASPAAITYAAGLGAFGQRPDLVLSGINLGPNIGPAVVHSGTVGAALSAAAQGIPALAASISAFNPQHWDTAYPVIVESLRWLTTHPQDGRVLNVNLPDVPL